MFEQSSSLQLHSKHLVTYMAQIQKVAKPIKNPQQHLFKQRCQTMLKRQPNLQILNCLKDNNINIDMQTWSEQDMPFLQILLGLGVKKVRVSTGDAEKDKKSPRMPAKGKSNKNILFYEQGKFKEFMQTINRALLLSDTIKSLSFERIPLLQKHIKELIPCIQSSKKLKELQFASCHLTDQHIQHIKHALAKNQSLIALDLSGNELCQVGGMIGKILSEHSRRRSDVIFICNIRNEKPDHDISSHGLCQVNLQGNKLNDRSIQEMMAFLKDDKWTRCINLRANKIGIEGVKEFALLLKTNTTLISLDLRENEGLTKDYSRFIYRKLVINMERYREIKSSYARKSYHNQQAKISNQKQAITQRPSSKEKHSEMNAMSVPCPPTRELNYQSRDAPYLSSTQKLISKLQKQADNSPNKRNNITVDVVGATEKCTKCRSYALRMITLEKKNLDLQLQIRKLQQSPHQIVPAGIQPADDSLLMRMESVMNELTRILETAEDLHKEHTLINNISNPLSVSANGNNSLCKTVALYGRSQRYQVLEGLSREMEERADLERKDMGDASEESIGQGKLKSNKRKQEEYQY